MFSDYRSKKVVFVAHCLLNQNSISDGTADMPGQFKEVIDLLMANHVGIVQLPCPEMLCLGLDRQDKYGAKRNVLEENTRIRSLMEQEESSNLLRRKAQEIACTIREYNNYGFSIIGLIGVNRSPSCGIETTSIKGKEEPGAGVFMQIVTEELAKEGLPIKTIGVKTSRIEESIHAVQELCMTLPLSS